MIFFVGNDGTIFNNRSAPVYQGSAEANDIYLYAPFAANLSVSIAFILPNKAITQPALMTATGQLGSGENAVVNAATNNPLAGWKYTLPNNITEYYGDVTAQFFFYTATNKLLGTSSTTFRVGRGVPAELPAEPSEDIYTQILSAISAIQEDLANGYFSARSLRPYNSAYTYGQNEMVWYLADGSGTRGQVLKSLTDNNAQPPYISDNGQSAINSQYWSLVIDFDDIYSQAQSIADSVKAAAESAQAAEQSAQSAQSSATAAQSAAQTATQAARNAAESAQAAETSAQKAEQSATSIYALTIPHSRDSITTADFEPRPAEIEGNKIWAISSDAFLAMYEYAGGGAWSLMTAEDGAIAPLNLRGIIGTLQMFVDEDTGAPYYQYIPQGEGGYPSDELTADELKEQLTSGEVTVANATNATNAENATNATNATNAQTAQSAVSAQSAQTADNAASLGNIAASEYYSTQNKPTPADVGLGRTLTVEIAGTTAEFDGSEDVTIDVSQKYFHAIMYRWSALSADSFQAKVNIYIFLDTAVKQTNPQGFKDQLSDLGYTSMSNYYSADGYVITGSDATQRAVCGVFATDDGITVVYDDGALEQSHDFSDHSLLYSNDAVTPLITVNTQS